MKWQKKIDGAGNNVRVFSEDISKVENAYKIAEYAVREFEKIDILLNNAGIFKPTAFIEHTEEDFDNYINIVLKGKFFMAQAAVKQFLKPGKGGAIVHTGSMGALQAKFGAYSFKRVFSCECGGASIGKKYCS